MANLSILSSRLMERESLMARKKVLLMPLTKVFKASKVIFTEMLSTFSRRWRSLWVADGMWRYLETILHGEEPPTSTTSSGSFSSDMETTIGTTSFGPLHADQPSTINLITSYQSIIAKTTDYFVVFSLNITQIAWFPPWTFIAVQLHAKCATSRYFRAGWLWHKTHIDWIDLECQEIQWGNELVLVSSKQICSSIYWEWRDYPVDP